MPRLLVLSLSVMALILQSCSGCQNEPRLPGVEISSPAPDQVPQGEPPPGFDEGSDLGPTDALETPEDQRDLVPANEPDID